MFFILGIVASSDRLFNLTHDGFDPTFYPRFFTNLTDLFKNNQTAIDIALSACGNVETNQACFFDFAITDDLTLAVSGNDYLTQADSIIQLISKFDIFVFSFKEGMQCLK